MDITFNCNKCGQHIAIDEAGAGISIQCPKCATTLTVPSKTVSNTPPAPRVSSSNQQSPNPVSTSNRTRILVASAITVGLVILIVAARILFASPTLNGEAFLVMQSLDVKKLGDLKIYLLSNPYPALDVVTKGITDQYAQAQKKAAQADPITIDIEKQIADRKAELASLDGAKQKKLEATNRNLDEIRKQLNADLVNLKTNKLDIENQTTSLEQQSDRVEYEKLKAARSGIEARYAPLIQQADTALNDAKSSLQDYIARSLVVAAKLINDHIIAQNLKIDLIPQDGKSKGNSYDSYRSQYGGEIFAFEEVDGWELKYKFQRETGNPPLTCLISEKTGESSLDDSKTAAFKSFPRGLTDSNLRQSFITQFLTYKRQRTALEVAKSSKDKKLKDITEELRLTLQKFDFQNGTRLQSLEAQVQQNISRLSSLKAKLDSVNIEINGKEKILSRPEKELVADLREEIEKSFFARQAAIAEGIAFFEKALKPLIAKAYEMECFSIRGSAKDKVAEAIAGKIVANVLTDGEGRFTFRPPSTGEFVVYAKAQTAGGGDIYWFEKVNIGRRTASIKLSNSNSHTGTLSDLVLHRASD